MENENTMNSGNPQSFSNQQPLPNSTSVLVLGILSLVTCTCYGLPGLVLGIIALVQSSKSLKIYNENPNLYTQASFGNMKAGRVCAIIGTILASIFFLFMILYVMLVGTLVMSSFPWQSM